MMTDRMKNLLRYMSDKYFDTLFPFFNLVYLTNLFGNDIKTELNILAKKKIVTKREGVNAPLVEITTYGIEVLKKINNTLVDKTKYTINKNKY